MPRTRLAVEGLENRWLLSATVLNELLVNPPGTDSSYEYIELRGDPGGLLADLYVAHLEGDLSSNDERGVADYVRALSPHSLGTNGLLVIKSTQGGHTVPSETTVVTDTDFDKPAGVLEHGTVSFLLIQSDTPIVEGEDYDDNNNGILELPTGATVIDAVGWTDGERGDFVYGGVVLKQSSDTPPDGASRFKNYLQPATVAAWYNGDILPGAPENVTYDPQHASSNLPAGAKLTPGDTNSHATGIKLNAKARTLGRPDMASPLLSISRDGQHDRMVQDAGAFASREVLALTFRAITNALP